MGRDQQLHSNSRSGCLHPSAFILQKPHRLRGSHQLAPDITHCESVGTMLARMHLAGVDYPRYQPNLRGLAWWGETVPVVAPFLTPAL